MGDNHDILIDLAGTAAQDALSIVLQRAQLFDGGREQLAILTGAVAMIAGSIHGAVIDRDGCNFAGLDGVYQSIFDVYRREPIMTLEIVDALAGAN